MNCVLIDDSLMRFIIAGIIDKFYKGVRREKRGKFIKFKSFIGFYELILIPII